MNTLPQSLAAGYASLSAWADLFDRINVFPVADGDTGTNLRISLAPLRVPGSDGASLAKQLTRCATGNSGNIAAAFFHDFCQAETFDDLKKVAASGRNQAWQAISDPCPGTMLSVFDGLSASLDSHTTPETLYEPLRRAMQDAVIDSTHQLPDLQTAGVVDSGALAMYVFFDSYFYHLTRQSGQPVAIFELFGDKLAIDDAFTQQEIESHCVDAIIQADASQPSVQENLARLGESLVVIEDEKTYKVHIHTNDPANLRSRLGSLGEVVRFSDEKIMQTPSRIKHEPEQASTLHIVTDAAGSLPKTLAQRHNITLLDSYIVMGDHSQPESLCRPEEVYARMLRGEKLTTAQASTLERYQHYQSICAQYGSSLYLCVGAAFTGNYAAATTWRENHDTGGQLTVIDTGAASGRLALIALTTARFGATGAEPTEIFSFANQAMETCQEYVFIDELKYLVAGGRLSKASGFFGDLLHMKPVISPTKDGAKKVGVVRSRQGQLDFAVERLETNVTPSSRAIIMLQYSDNEQWVRTVALPRLQELLPDAEIILTPLSLTSGVHMGPGTWSLAFSPPVESPAPSRTGGNNAPKKSLAQ